MTIGSMNDIFLSHWSDFGTKLKGQSPNQSLTGRNLDIATVVATARYVEVLIEPAKQVN